jgi:hypothetical protein
MNYTNKTTETPVCQQSISKCEGRDTAYIVFSTFQIIFVFIQIVITCGGLYWANHIIKNKELKNETERTQRKTKDQNERIEREARDKKERMEREARDRIAEIVSSEYYNIENKHINLQKCKKKFETMIIFSDTSPSPITGLDVLKYMCHPDNYPNHRSEMLSKLDSDLSAVVRLFKSFRIKLPPDGICPDNIREELGPPIIELGDITAAFVSGKNYNTISKVMKYFGSNLEPDAAKNEKVKSKIPYIGDLCFGLENVIRYPANMNYHDTDFTLKCKPVQGNKEKQITSNLKILASHLREKKEKICNTDELAKFVGTIEEIWSKNEQLKKLPKADYRVQDKLRVNVLHAVCVFWFLVTDDGGIIHDQQFKLMVEEMLKITNVPDSERQKGRCRQNILHIRRAMDTILSTSPQFMYLCEQKTIADKLEKFNQDLSTSIAKHLKAKIAGNFPGGISRGDVIHTTQP